MAVPSSGTANGGAAGAHSSTMNSPLMSAGILRWTIVPGFVLPWPFRRRLPLTLAWDYLRRLSDSMSVNPGGLAVGGGEDAGHSYPPRSNRRNRTSKLEVIDMLQISTLIHTGILHLGVRLIHSMHRETLWRITSRRMCQLEDAI